MREIILFHFIVQNTNGRLLGTAHQHVTLEEKLKGKPQWSPNTSTSVG